MLTARSTSSALAALVLGIALSGQALAKDTRTPPAITPPAPSSTSATAAQHGPVLMAEGASKTACESVVDRVHVRHKLGSECIAFFATTIAARDAGTPAVFFFNGDVAVERIGDQARSLEVTKIGLQRLTDRYQVRFVHVSRSGVDGSSGNHALRRRPAEMLSMNAAVDAIKARLGLGDIVIAGQSGGSTVGAMLLAQGRRDIRCAVLGSGLYDTIASARSTLAEKRLPMPSNDAIRRVLAQPFDGIPKFVADPARRIVVLGDPRDTRTPFEQQARYAAEIGRRGHHALSVDVVGRGDLNHGAAHLALPAAAMCAKGQTDASIIAFAKGHPAPAASAAPGNFSVPNLGAPPKPVLR